MRKSEDRNTSKDDERRSMKENIKDTLNIGSTKIFLGVFACMIVYVIVMMVLKSKNIV